MSEPTLMGRVMAQGTIATLGLASAYSWYVAPEWAPAATTIIGTLTGAFMILLMLHVTLNQLFMSGVPLDMSVMAESYRKGHPGGELVSWYGMLRMGFIIGIGYAAADTGHYGIGLMCLAIISLWLFSGFQMREIAK